MPHISSDLHAHFARVIPLLLKEVQIKFLPMNYVIYQKA